VLVVAVVGVATELTSNETEDYCNRVLLVVLFVLFLVLNGVVL
jgi:hypothetical protein